MVDVTKTKAALFIKVAMAYGVGTPNKQAKDGGHHTLTISPWYPLGVDPVAMREANEAAEIAKGLRKAPPAATGVRAGVAQPVGKRPVSALMKASGAVKAFKDDEGNVLEMVTDQDLGDRPDMDIPSS